MGKTDELLSNVKFFAGLTPKQRKRIAGLMTPLDVNAGKELISEGTVGREFFVIVEGDASVSRGGREVATLGAGDHFGEIALLDESPRTATVTASSEMKLEVLSRSEFSDLLEQAPELSRLMMKSLAAILEARTTS